MASAGSTKNTGRVVVTLLPDGTVVYTPAPLDEEEKTSGKEPTEKDTKTLLEEADELGILGAKLQERLEKLKALEEQKKKLEAQKAKKAQEAQELDAWRKEKKQQEEAWKQKLENLNKLASKKPSRHEGVREGVGELNEDELLIGVPH